MDEPENTGSNRTKKGQWKPGISGNPAGKPLGAVSIVAKIKAQFRENPEYFDEWVKELMEDKANRRAVMEQIDGKPIQPISNADGTPFVIQVMKYGDNNPTPPIQP